MAKVALSFDAWKVGEVAAATIEVPVIVHEVKDSPELLATLRGHDEAPYRVAVALDGKTLATSTMKGEVKLWDVASKKERATLTSDLGNSYNLAFAPDSKTLAVGYHQWDDKHTKIGGGVVLWDVVEGKKKARLQTESPRGVSQLAFSPDGKTLAGLESIKDGAKADFRVQLALWDVEAGKVRTTLPLKDSGAGLTFSPDGKSLVMSVMIHENNRWTGSEIRRWDVETGKALPAWPYPSKHKDQCAVLAFSPDGQSLAGANSSGNVLVWDSTTGKVRSTWKVEDKRSLRSLSFSPDSRTLAITAGSQSRDPEPGIIVLWDAKEGRRLGTLTGHLGEVYDVAFSPDGKTLLSASADKTIRLWDMTNRRVAKPAADQ